MYWEINSMELFVCVVEEVVFLNAVSTFVCFFVSF
jgi:hypothetical protein